MKYLGGYMDKKAVFVRVPCPGKDDKYVQVDPDRHEGWDYHYHAYQKELGMGGWGFVKIQQLARIKTQQIFSPAKLLSVVEEICQQTSDILDTNLDQAESLKKLVPKEQLASLINKLSRNQLSEAEEILQEWLYEFMGNLSDLSTKLHTLETTASGMTESYQDIHEAWQKSGDISTNLVIKWAEAAQGLVKAVYNLDDLESKLKNIISLAGKSRQSWENLVDPKNPSIARALSFFSISGGFNEKALILIGKPVIELEDCGSLITEALDLITTCKQLERDARNRWTIERDRLIQLSLDIPREIGMLMQPLKENQKWFNEYAEGFRNDKVLLKPYQVDEGKLISQDDFNWAEQISQMEEWKPLVCKNRLEHYAQTIQFSAREMPQLPIELTREIADAERYIILIQESLQAFKPVFKAAAAPAPIPPSPLSHSAPKPSLEIDAQRMKELYEIAICIGFVLTSNSNYFSSSRINSLLDLAFRAGKCSKKEIELYSPVIEEFIEVQGLIEDASKGNLVKIWKTSKKTWVREDNLLQYNKERTWGMKLSQNQDQLAYELLGKHKLQVNSLKQLYQNKKKENFEKREDFKKKVESKINKPSS